MDLKAFRLLIIALLMFNFLTAAGASAQSLFNEPYIKQTTCDIAKSYGSARLPVTFSQNDYPMLQQPLWQYKRGIHYPEFYVEYEGNHDADEVDLKYDKDLTSNDKVLSNSDKQKLLLQAKDIKRETQYQCCGSDFKCNQLYSDLKFEFCDSTERWCYNYARGAFVLFSQVRKINLMNALKHLPAIETPKNFKSAFKEIIGKTPSEFSTEVAETENENKEPLSGYIQLNPFEDKWSSGFPEYLFRHEFGHACSYIRKQAAAFRGSATYRSNIVMDLARRHVGQCKITRETQETYRVIARPQMSAGTIDCLIRMSEKSVDPKSSSYINGACPTEQLEEAYAMAFALLKLPSEEAFLRGMSAIPSRAHPKMGLVLKCLMTYQNSFQSSMERFLCKPE